MEQPIRVFHKNLGKKRIWGQAFTETNIIEIDTRAKGKKFLEILIHEVNHICFSYLTEEEITKKSIQITNVLWEQGIRPTDNTNNINLQDGSL